uniref:Uncharacterized protein n=1 Tax=Alexandrium monilatum TaxID=311494 RepID=A0A6T1ML05_9DINO
MNASLTSKVATAWGPPMKAPMSWPTTGGDGHQSPTGSPVRQSKTVPYCGSMIVSPSTSAPRLKEVPVGGALSPMAKSFPEAVRPRRRLAGSQVLACEGGLDPRHVRQDLLRGVAQGRPPGPALPPAGLAEEQSNSTR